MKKRAEKSPEHWKMIEQGIEEERVQLRKYDNAMVRMEERLVNEANSLIGKKRKIEEVENHKSAELDSKKMKLPSI